MVGRQNARAGGGTAEAEAKLFASVGEHWNLGRKGIEEILESKALWAKQCRERGVSSTGLLRNEAQLPKYLRKSRRSTGTVMRAKGGGRQDHLKWMYPLVQAFLFGDEALRQVCGWFRS